MSVAIYDDRLEISSTGSLPFGLTVEDLARPHPSRPWNPLIAQVFYRRRIIETWGRGTLKMAELTHEAGLAPPEFEATAGEVVLRFRPRDYTPPLRVTRDLSPLQREVLEILAQEGPSSLSRLRERLRAGAAERTLQENLAALRHLGLVDLAGRGRGARWYLKGASR